MNIVQIQNKKGLGISQTFFVSALFVKLQECLVIGYQLLVISYPSYHCCDKFINFYIELPVTINQ